MAQLLQQRNRSHPLACTASQQNRPLVPDGMRRYAVVPGLRIIFRVPSSEIRVFPAIFCAVFVVRDGTREGTRAGAWTLYKSRTIVLSHTCSRCRRRGQDSGPVYKSIVQIWPDRAAGLRVVEVGYNRS